jgi:hypothetical protein
MFLVLARSRACVIGVLAAAAASVSLAPAALAAPPNIPSKATAQSELNALTVAAEGSMTGYSRDLFPTWITISGTCNTREWVLKRDGTSVVTGGDCVPTSGSWFSEYDGVTISPSSGVDIDHVVPLAEAWRSGAAAWSTSTRQGFANDVTRPQLIAVSASSNRSKGDQDPSTWQPTRTAYRCTYSKMWIASKSYWGLWLQSTEKSALQVMLNTCP